MDVTAPGHNPYHGTLHLIAGETNEIDPFLSRQLVTYTWNVVPVSLADQYTVSLDATFETHVPAPVVTVSPATLNLATLNYDSSGKAVVNYTLTNVGLIAAQDVHFAFTSDAFFTVTTSLEKIGTIPALTSVVVPVTIVKIAAAGSRPRRPPCTRPRRPPFRVTAGTRWPASAGTRTSAAACRRTRSMRPSSTSSSPSRAAAPY